ncbi:hypothetical protein WL26_03870 [Burkholderia cepacia]|uniref:hypothetical protein n=1 Tax=Burkholderia cepacia TaxID=292 RepID=UPI000758DE90|nr:hypothetical protein [Burkholderia cepacia]KWA17367.1 hypothetical protein WL26_03870 [Burkholderia cepacia]
MMKHRVTLRTAIKFGAVALLSFEIGRLSTQIIGSMFEWPSKPGWMDVNVAGVIVNGVVAVGTCAAVFVALGIAVRQNQQKLRDELNRAKLTAVGATFRLGAARGYILEAIDQVAFNAKSNSKLSNESLMKLIKILRDSDVIEWSEIHNLASLPGNAGVYLACAKDRIHLVIATLESVVNYPSGEDPSEQEPDDLIAALDDVERWLAKAFDICETETRGFAPDDGSIELRLTKRSTTK